ncbi:hypothetical protein BKA63DRAFT_507613 [Paraphoma chrysanthemicola]|nr:hypothetical protein BKA63DRAFT_507613 [Paraphoma chrysanthemicola]
MMLSARITTVLVTLSIISTTISCADTNHGIIATSPALDQTPLEGCDGQQGDPVPGEFFVHLNPGWPLADHLLIVGPDLEAHLDRVHDAIWTDCVVYTCSTVSHSLLARIRADVNVMVVRCNVFIFVKWD